MPVGFTLFLSKGMDNDRNQYAKLVDRTYDLTADAPHKLREKPEQSYSTVRVGTLSLTRTPFFDIFLSFPN